ncbi:MAG: hypothetical protein R3C01_04435 [Planctomycetaceae bacterium]
MLFPERIETLESRLLLAGNVTAVLKGSTLVITGDAAGNSILVTETDDHAFSVQGRDTSVNGVVDGLATFEGVSNIKIDLKGGNDFFSMMGDLHAELKSVSVKLGDGDDDAASVINGGSGTIYAGIHKMRIAKLTVDTGDGDDTFVLAGSQINKSLNAKSGDGDDVVTISSNIISGKVAVNTGNGNDVANFHSTGGTVFTKAVSIKMGAGNDTVNLQPIFGSITFHEQFKLDGGPGFDKLVQNSSGGDIVFLGGTSLKNLE